MQVFASISRLSHSDMYSFHQLFTKAEIEAGRWFITQMYDQQVMVELVQDLGGDASMVRSHADTEDTFFYAIVA